MRSSSSSLAVSSANPAVTDLLIVASSTLTRAGYGLGIRGLVEIAAGLGSIRCPVAVVYGTGDQVLPDVGETFERLQRDVPHAVITPLPGLGHFVTKEAPAAVLAALAPFVAAT